jgi:hypothetical protein
MNVPTDTVIKHLCINSYNQYDGTNVWGPSGKFNVVWMCICGKTKKKLRGFGPLSNYADRATAASWRSSANFCG